VAVRAVIFDVDGTLLDTNCAHINAWHRALLKLGFEVTLERIAPEIGKGGDKLVPAILGQALEKERGEEIRKVQKREFLEIASRTRFALFPGSRELLAALREKGVPTAIATSSNVEHFDAIMKSTGVDLRSLVDHTVTKSEGVESKPAPDLVDAAVAKLGITPGACLMVGDTPHDGMASRRAGVPFLGVLCGGNARETLEWVGATRVCVDPKDLLSQLDQVLSARASDRQMS
jgi:HAD superfamily hydrolase (TIGR01509 family)